jgi:hypothetical protein
MWIKIRRQTPRSRKARDRAVIAAHAHVPHAPAGLAADAEADHLVVLPERTVKKHKRTSGQAAPEAVGHRRTTGDKKEGPCGLGIDDLKTNCIPVFAQYRSLVGGFEVQGHLAGMVNATTASPEAPDAPPSSTRCSNGSSIRRTQSRARTPKIGFAAITARTLAGA